jgi:signal transduction histidine kinase
MAANLKNTAWKDPAQVERERLLETLPAAAYVCDAGGLITFFNERAVQLWGREPKACDPVDRYCGSFQLFSPSGVPIPHDKCWMAEALREGREVIAREIVIGRPDGIQLTALAHISPIFNERKRVVGAVNVLIDITECKRQEQALRESEERSRAALLHLQTLSRQLLNVQEAEKRHLARELHDEVGQLLTGVRLLLNSIADARPFKREQAQVLVDRLIEKVRGMSFDLRPAVLDQLGLFPALLELFENYTRQTGVLVSFKHKDLERRLSVDVETTAYRLVQEALTNVARHAGVPGVAVRTWIASNGLNVQIEDGGRGFVPEAALNNSRSSGLAGMRERARLLGGHFTIDSRPGKGTQVTAELPLA